MNSRSLQAAHAPILKQVAQVLRQLPTKKAQFASGEVPDYREKPLPFNPTGSRIVRPGRLMCDCGEESPSYAGAERVECPMCDRQYDAEGFPVGEREAQADDDEPRYDFKSGDRVRLKGDYKEGDGSEVFTLTDWDGERGWVEDKQGRGWGVRGYQIEKAGRKKKAQVGLLQDPTDFSVVQADPELESIRSEAQAVQTKVQDVLARAQAYVDALANKEGAPNSGGMMALQQEATRLQTELESRLKALPQNFIKFADGTAFAKVQSARLNDASWKDMIDAARTRGRGVMKRVTQILDRLSILFKKMTADVKLKEYGPGELTEKEVGKVTKKNQENTAKINQFADDVQAAQPQSQRYFLDNAEGGMIQKPGFKGAKRQAQADLEPTAELDLWQEYNESLQDSQQDISYINQDIDKAMAAAKQQEAIDRSYPLPDSDQDGMQKAAAFKFSTALKGGLQPVRRLSARKNFTAAELREAKVGK